MTKIASTGRASGSHGGSRRRTGRKIRVGDTGIVTAGLTTGVTVGEAVTTDVGDAVAGASTSIIGIGNVT